MKLEILVSAVNEDVDTLAERMNLQADAIIVNQCGENTYREYTYQEHRIRCYSFAERGVGLSRNNCLMRAQGDICLFADEDIIYLSLIHIYPPRLKTTWRPIAHSTVRER